MPEILETIMLICFGVSWPISIYKNYKSRTAAGMSKFFIYLIIVGYIAGITAKIATENYSYVLVAYIINLVMLLINLCIYYRNSHLDRQREQNEVKSNTVHEGNRVLKSAK